MKNAVLVLASFYFLLVPKSFSQSPADSSYWPLGLNYSWTYTFMSRLDTSQIDEKIVDTVRIGDNTYYLIDWFGGMVPNFLVRRSGETYFYYQTADSTEYILYNFTARDGESWNLDTNRVVEYLCTIGSKITLVSKTDTVSTPAGVFFNCIHMRYMSPCADAGWLDSWFARGVGRVKNRQQNFFGENEAVLDHSTVTSIREPGVSGRRPTLVLSQSYPNPVSVDQNRQTTIRYTLPAASDVRIDLYDALGRKVRTLYTGYQSGGTHEITFDPASLSCGVYFYRIRSGQSTLARKMILVK